MADSNPKPKAIDLTFHRILPPKAELCDHPAYLFWKVQSQLTKLNNRLTRTSHPAKIKQS